jgi:hypothetical protein
MDAANEDAAVQNQFLCLQLDQVKVGRAVKWLATSLDDRCEVSV